VPSEQPFDAAIEAAPNHWLEQLAPLMAFVLAALIASIL
jgi:hypothetical protein